MRGNAFHWSSSSRSRLAPWRQSVPAASFSASPTMRSFSTLASACFCARSALRASRCSPISVAERVEPVDQSGEVADGVGVGHLSAHRPDRLGGLLGRHHTRLDPLVEQLDLEGQRVVAVGVELQSLLGVPSGYCPTERSPSAVLTKTVPSSATRPIGGPTLGSTHSQSSQSRALRRAPGLARAGGLAANATLVNTRPWDLTPRGRSRVGPTPSRTVHGEGTQYSRGPR